MKWFKVDSNTPRDPRIQDVIHQHGNAGLGALVRLWCFVAEHGNKRIGWSIDSHGRPIPLSAVREATGLTEPEFDLLMGTLTRNRHISKVQLERKGVIAIPAMFKRGDTYTQRHLRRGFAHSSKFVPVEEKRREESTKETPLPPFGKGGRVTRQDLNQAKERRAKVYGGCPHEPRCPDYAACIRLLALDAKART